jgi:hypothetical protein
MGYSQPSATKSATYTKVKERKKIGIGHIMGIVGNSLSKVGQLIK